MKKILVTGSAGFVGTNLCRALKAKGYHVYGYDKNNTDGDLDIFCKDADFVFNLAGVMRPSNKDDFYKVNSNFATKICNKLTEYGNNAPVVLTSSIHAERDDDYGKSKLMAEKAMFEHANKNNSKTYIFRLTNLFGEFAKPNYSSVVATWCYNAQRNLPLEVTDESIVITLCYIKDIVAQFLQLVENESSNMYHRCNVTHEITLGNLRKLILNIKRTFKDGAKFNAQNAFEQNIYDTYITYGVTNEQC